jgi:hypothetical protein
VTGAARAAEFDALLEAIAKTRWFARAGRKPSPAEARAAKAWAQGLGFARTRPAHARDWRAARRIASDPAQGRGWWTKEERLRRGLLKRAERLLGRGRALELLTQAAMRAHGRAAGAAARKFPDELFAAAAAGAATQACYLGALALLAGAGPDHAFSAKLGLFQSGRWPLGIRGGRAYIF